MTARHERNPEWLAAEYRRACRARGDTPKRVLGLVALAGATHPEGTILTWGLNRPYMDAQLEQRRDADKWEIRELAEPTEEPTP